MVVYEVVSEYQGVPNTTKVLNNYPHIFIKLCNGEIINAESGERIIKLSQFMVANNLNVMDTTEADPQSQLSQHLVIDSDYFMSNPETTTNNLSDHRARR